MVVVFHFQLLPRWAIVIVVAREMFMLALSRYGLARGIELKINWPGRLGVAPTWARRSSPWPGVHWLALIMLYVGMALSLTATALYVRSGIRQLRDREQTGDSPAVDRP